MSRHWMPMYWSDFKADTEHLGALETGAYMMLIGHYWNTGSLPNDDIKLARIARMTPEEWAIAKSTIAEFFQDGWKHKRIDIELSKNNDISERRSAAANKRWKCKSNANAYASDVRLQPQPHILDTNVSNNKREPSSLEILCEVLSEATASDLLTHRQAKKSKLTPRAAKELVKAFKAYGDPEAAAAEMMLRGWIGFKPDWMENNQRAGPIQNSDPNRRGGLARLYREICERENEIEAKVSDGNVLRLSSVHGVG